MSLMIATFGPQKIDEKAEAFTESFDAPQEFSFWGDGDAG